MIYIIIAIFIIILFYIKNSTNKIAEVNNKVIIKNEESEKMIS